MFQNCCSMEDLGLNHTISEIRNFLLVNCFKLVQQQILILKLCNFRICIINLGSVLTVNSSKQLFKHA